MDQAIAHTGNLMPRNIRMGIKNIFGKFFRCFADNGELSHRKILDENIFFIQFLIIFANQPG